MELHINYKASELNWDSDIAYLKSVGVTGIRPHLPAISYPWTIGADTSGSFAYWRRMAKYFSSKGFYVSWGIAGYNGFNGDKQLTATKWIEYRQIILAEAAYLQQQGIAITFEIGNELEPKVDGTTLSIPQLIANLSQLATDVKAVYSIGKVAYSTWDYLGTTYDAWIAKGKGGLDYINVHPYCNNTGDNITVKQYSFDSIAKMVAKFGTACQVTEFGMEAGLAAYTALAQSTKNQKIGELWDYMKNLGVQKAYIYSYVGMLDSNNDYAMKKTDGTFDPQWNVLLSKIAPVVPTPVQPQINIDIALKSMEILRQVSVIVFGPDTVTNKVNKLKTLLQNPIT